MPTKKIEEMYEPYKDKIISNLSSIPQVEIDEKKLNQLIHTPLVIHDNNLDSSEIFKQLIDTTLVKATPLPIDAIDSRPIFTTFKESWNAPTFNDEIRNIESELGMSIKCLFDYKEPPFAKNEIDTINCSNKLLFDGDSFYGPYSKEEWLNLIKRMIRAYIIKWGNPND